MEITAQSFINQLYLAADVCKEPREGKNLHYSLIQSILGAFAVFVTQSPSFLYFQQMMEARTGTNNAKSLFGIKKIPGSDQIRDTLDLLTPEVFLPVFRWNLETLIEHGGIEEFKSELGYYLLIDGTQTHSSDEIYCKNCLTKTDKKGNIHYYHSVLTPVLAKPGGKYVLPLMPEFIQTDDGSEKQGCEINAGKRWIKTQGRYYAEKLGATGQKVICLGDDLYSRQPYILSMGPMQFILVCKRESHKVLYRWLDNLREADQPNAMHVMQQCTVKGHLITTYKYANHVPLNGRKDTLFVNWCSVEIRNKKDHLVYHNAFVTYIPITKDNITAVTTAGRTRWKIENENNNTLKTKGYHFEHNYGHGKEQLSSVLTTLIILAFLLHIMLELFCKLYANLLILTTKQKAHEGIRVLTQIFEFYSWEHLFSGMAYGLSHKQPFPYGERPTSGTGFG
jgi:hypothetical protein